MESDLIDFPEGITADLSMDNYHNDPAYSKSDIVNAERSTKYMQDMRKQRMEPSPAMLLGTATHLMILEPDRVESDLYITDCQVRRGKKWEEEKAENEGKIIITRKEMDLVVPMVESVFDHPIAAPLFKNGLAEVSCKTILKIASENGLGSIALPVKCRPDYMPKKQGVVVDLKTARDVTPEGFGRAAYKYRYHWSAYLTCLILELLTGIKFDYHFVVVENSYPFETVVYRANDFDLQVAENEISPILYDLAIANEKSSFCSIAKFEILDLQLPAWANKNAMVPDF